MPKMKLSASAGAGIAKSAITAPARPHTQNRIDRCIMAALPDWMCDRFAGNHGQFVFAGPQVKPLAQWLVSALSQPTRLPHPSDCAHGSIQLGERHCADGDAGSDTGDSPGDPGHDRTAA